MNRRGFYYKGRTATIFLCAFLLTITVEGQEADTSITISYFMYPKIEGIPIILDEGGQNSFYLDIRHPHILTDYSISHIMIDGALHLPQGSYFLPKLLPKTGSADSVHNSSQIHYKKGDYGAGELGLAWQIEGSDNSYFTLQGFRQSPPVMHSYSSLSDNLQNYLMSYERLSEDGSLSVDVMYHLENYHLQLESGDYKREAESFHGGLSYEKKWGALKVDFHPAFQLTQADRQDSLATYFTFWNLFSSRLDLGDHFNLSLQQKYKMMMVEKDNQLNGFEKNIVHPRLQYHSDRIMLEGGAALSSGLFKPEGKATWRYKNLYVSAGREFHIYFEPKHMSKYGQNKYSITSYNISYLSSPLNVILDIFQIDDESHPGVIGGVEIDVSWLRLSQKAGIYNIDSDEGCPLDMFSHLSLLFSPNIWGWSTARFQPFVGVESIFLQHSGNVGIDPAAIPVFKNLDFGSQPYSSHLINMEFGFLVNRFKVSYRWMQFNILGDAVQNSHETNPLTPVRYLEVVWQFFD